MDVKNSSSTKNKHITSGFSLTTIERGKDCMKKFCQFLKWHTIKIRSY